MLPDGADLIQLADTFIAGGAQQVAFNQLILLDEWHHLLHLQSKVLALPIENDWVSGLGTVTPLLVLTSLESTQASNKGRRHVLLDPKLESSGVGPCLYVSLNSKQEN